MNFLKKLKKKYQDWLEIRELMQTEKAIRKKKATINYGENDYEAILTRENTLYK